MDTIPVVFLDGDKEKALKIGYMTLFDKLFMVSQKWDTEKNRKSVYVL